MNLNCFLDILVHKRMKQGGEEERGERKRGIGRGEKQGKEKGARETHREKDDMWRSFVLS